MILFMGKNVLEGRHWAKYVFCMPPSEYRVIVEPTDVYGYSDATLMLVGRWYENKGNMRVLQYAMIHGFKVWRLDEVDMFQVTTKGVWNRLKKLGRDLKKWATTFTAICILLCAGTAHAQWFNKEETVAEITWQTLHILDWGTTLDIANHEGYYEVNPILGKHPTRTQINTYMFASAVLHPIVTYALPREAYLFGKQFHPRRLFQYITIGMSGACVVNNFSIGLRLDF